MRTSRLLTTALLLPLALAACSKSNNSTAAASENSMPAAEDNAAMSAADNAMPTETMLNNSMAGDNMTSGAATSADNAAMPAAPAGNTTSIKTEVKTTKHSTSSQ